MEKEGKAPEMVMLTGCCCERDSDCGTFENTLQDVFQHDGMRGDATGREESDSWELDMWCFSLHVPYFSTYEHGSNICSGNQHPHVEDYYNCFSNILRSQTAQFSHFKSVEYSQENRKPIHANFGRKQKYECPRGKQTRDRALNCDTFAGCEAGGRCLRLIRLEKWSAHPLQK